MKKSTWILIIWLSLALLLAGLIWLSSAFFPGFKTVLCTVILFYCILSPAMIALLHHLKKKGK